MNPISPGVARTLVARHPRGARQSHASTLLDLTGGQFLIAWFAGSHEGASDTRIWLTHGRPESFAEPRVVGDAPGPHWNPVLAHGPDGRIWLFFRRGPSIDSWTTWVCHSGDGGHTWDAPAELVPGEPSRGPVRQAPVHYRDWWVAPGSMEVWEPTPTWDCLVDLTRDGHHWQSAAVPLDHQAIRGAGAIQPALIPGRTGQLIMLTRSSGGRVLRSATDDPRTWPPLEPCALPNNNSGLAAVALPDGRIACVHNPATDDWGARCPLVAAISSDEGHTWQHWATLENGQEPLAGAAPGRAPAPASGTGSAPASRAAQDNRAPQNAGAPQAAAATGVVTSGVGEYSYPSAVVVDDVLWVSYSWQRQGIALAQIPVPEPGR